MTPVYREGGNIVEPSYEQWLRRQPRSFIEEVLGKRKAELFLRGDVSLDRFVDESGNESTVRELSESKHGS